MDQRVIVGLVSGTDWQRLKAALLTAGATHLSEPVSYQPDVTVATLPAGRDAQAFMAKAKKMKGVRYCEPDAMSGTF